eukprot:1401781-Prymnesium_polylepis.1
MHDSELTDTLTAFGLRPPKRRERDVILWEFGEEERINLRMLGASTPELKRSMSIAVQGGILFITFCRDDDDDVPYDR